ncbi:MAG: imidazoleglycerol-phosphate dehydratase HisB, partial [Balneolaceae bacterium]
MKIIIHSSALLNKPETLLPEGALYGMRTLIESGAELSFDSTALSKPQLDLLKNEGIPESGFNESEADGSIKKEGHFLFISGDNVIEECENWPEIARSVLFPSRRASLTRNTKETQISVTVNLDGTGKSNIDTGLDFFDHMLEQIARHGLMDIQLGCKGDLNVDEHHTIEDSAIALGRVIRDAISENKAGIQRYGFVLPMDEAQATVAIDLSDRPFLRWDVPLKREYVGDFPTEMLE